MTSTYTFEKIRITGIDTTKTYTDADFPIQGTKRILCNGVDRIHKTVDYKEYISLPSPKSVHDYRFYKNAMLNALDSLGITYTYEDTDVSTDIYGCEVGTLVLNTSFPEGVGFALEDEEGDMNAITITKMKVFTLYLHATEVLHTSIRSQDGVSLDPDVDRLFVYGTTTEY